MTARRSPEAEAAFEEIIRVLNPKPATQDGWLRSAFRRLLRLVGIR